MVRADDEGRCEGDVEPHLLSSDRTFATGELVRHGVDAVDDRIVSGELRTEERRAEGELARQAAVTSSESIVGGRVYPSDDLAVGGKGRVDRKDVVEFDLNLCHGAERR